MNETLIKIILICFTVVWLAAMPLFYLNEKKKYNNGKCKCGGNWRYFDTDSQGGEGYKCDKCKDVMWISWYRPHKRCVDLTDDTTE